MKKSILFVCNHNSGRSQIAEFLLKKKYGSEYHVESAGASPAPDINPLVKEVLGEVDIDVGSAAPKHFDELSNQKFDYIISVCDAKAEECPANVLGAIPLNLGIPDPAILANATNNKKKRLQYFRDARE